MAPALHTIHQDFDDVSPVSPSDLLASEKNSRPAVSGQSREDRVRAVFGARNGGTLPAVNRASLLAYYKYLRAHFSTPFQAEHYSVDSRLAHRVTVIDLLSPSRPDADTSRGLVCLARDGNRVLCLPLVDLEVREDNPNFHLLEDYWYWVWNWGTERPA